MLSTGQVAKLCGVKADTVLKWIRDGKVRATRTYGGHFRIHADDASALLSRRQNTTALRVFNNTPSAPAREHLRCWEYMPCGAGTPGDCHRCAVYLTRAAWCFELRRLTAGCGQMAVYCDTTCADCTYFRHVTSSLTEVLIVTSDSDVEQSLRTEHQGLRLTFAHNAYEAGARVATSKPAFAVLDLDPASCEQWQLLIDFQKDRQTRGIHVILVEHRRRASADRELPPGVIAALRKPFDASDLTRIVDAYHVEKAPCGYLDVAAVGQSR